MAPHLWKPVPPGLHPDEGMLVPPPVTPTAVSGNAGGGANDNGPRPRP
jgi:hypothetical protein